MSCTPHMWPLLDARDLGMHCHNRLLLCGPACSEKQRSLQQLVANWHTAHTAGFFCGGLDGHRPKWGFTEER